MARPSMSRARRSSSSSSCCRRARSSFATSRQAPRSPPGWWCTPPPPAALALEVKRRPGESSCLVSVALPASQATDLCCGGVEESDPVTVTPGSSSHAGCSSGSAAAPALLIPAAPRRACRRLGGVAPAALDGCSGATLYSDTRSPPCCCCEERLACRWDAPLGARRSRAWPPAGADSSFRAAAKGLNGAPNGGRCGFWARSGLSPGPPRKADGGIMPPAPQVVPFAAHGAAAVGRGGLPKKAMGLPGSMLAGCWYCGVGRNPCSCCCKTAPWVVRPCGGAGRAAICAHTHTWPTKAPYGWQACGLIGFALAW